MSTANHFLRSTRDVQCSTVVRIHPLLLKALSPMALSAIREREMCTANMWFSLQAMMFLKAVMTLVVKLSWCEAYPYPYCFWAVELFAIHGKYEITTFSWMWCFFPLSLSFKIACTFPFFSLFIYFRKGLGLLPVIILWKNDDEGFFHELIKNQFLPYRCEFYSVIRAPHTSKNHTT